MTADRGGAPESRRIHDIRNHLSVIIGYCDLLLSEIPTGDRKLADVTEIRKSAVAAMSLLDDADERS